MNINIFGSTGIIGKTTLELIDKNCKDLKMEDLGLLWQLTIKTIEDLKLISNENIALEMYVTQLIHVKSIESHADQESFSGNPSSEIINPRTTIDRNNIDLPKGNTTKNQLKNIDQIKTLNKETEKDQKLQVNSFSDLIYLAEKNKESELKYDLERNVKLVKFDNGKIDINFNENLNKNFIKNLSKNLYEWTGKRWIISLSKKQGLQTLHESKIEEKVNSLNLEKTSSVFKEMLKEFPDAELIDVMKEDD